MAKIDEVLRILHSLRKDNGKVISLSAVYKIIIREGIYNSYKAISDSLKRLESIGKIKLVNFGNNIELLDEELSERMNAKIEFVQSSLLDLKKSM